MRVPRNHARRLVFAGFCFCCASCSNSDQGTPKILSIAQIVSEQEAITTAKEEMARQKPFGISRISEDEYEVDASITDDGDWLVNFDRKPPSSPGSYFFAIVAKSGKVQFWPGK